MEYGIINNQEDIRDSIIQKKGHVITFTLNDVMRHTTELKKLLTQLNAQIEHEAAKIENITHFHPEIAEMAGEKLTAAALYKAADEMIKQCKAKVDEVQKQIDDYTSELADISSQIPEIGEAIAEDKQREEEAKTPDAASTE